MQNCEGRPIFSKLFSVKHTGSGKQTLSLSFEFQQGLNAPKSAKFPFTPTILRILSILNKLGTNGKMEEVLKTAMISTVFLFMCQIITRFIFRCCFYAAQECYHCNTSASALIDGPWNCEDEATTCESGQDHCLYTYWKGSLGVPQVAKR